MKVMNSGDELRVLPVEQKCRTNPRKFKKVMNVMSDELAARAPSNQNYRTNPPPKTPTPQPIRPFPHPSQTPLVAI